MKNSDWIDTINVTGVEPSLGINKFNDVTADEGFYVGQIKDCWIDSEKNENLVKFRLSITSGKFEGATCWGSLMKQGSTEFDNAKHWRTLYQSIGYQAAHLDVGSMETGGQFFTDKNCCFYWKPGDRDAGIWDDFKFLIPSDWRVQKQEFDAATLAAPTSTVAAPAPALPSPVAMVPNPTPVAIPQLPTPVASTPSNGAAAALPQAGIAPPNMSADQFLNLINNA